MPLSICIRSVSGFQFDSKVPILLVTGTCTLNGCIPSSGDDYYHCWWFIHSFASMNHLLLFVVVFLVLRPHWLPLHWRKASLWCGCCGSSNCSQHFHHGIPYNRMVHQPPELVVLSTSMVHLLAAITRRANDRHHSWLKLIDPTIVALIWIAGLWAFENVILYPCKWWQFWCSSSIGVGSWSMFRLAKEVLDLGHGNIPLTAELQSARSLHMWKWGLSLASVTRKERYP